MKANTLIVAIFFTCVCFLSPQAQEVIISGSPAERQLVWEDFQGKANKHTPYFAETFWKIDYKTGPIKSGGGNISPDAVIITLRFDNKKSWLKDGKGTVDLLKHEQGHFDIGRLCQLEMMAALKSTILTPGNLGVKMQEIFDSSFQKYDSMGKKYDEETNHSINKLAQEKWNDFFNGEKERLLKLNE